MYLRKSRPNRDNKFPVYIRITVQNERLQYPSGQFVDSEHWDDKKQKAIKSKDAGTINSMLDVARNEINQTISQLYISKTEVTFDNIRQLLKGEPIEETHTFISVAQEHNDNFEKQIGKKYSQGSYKNYKTTLKYLIEFVPIYCGKKDMPLKAVNYKFCEAYFTYLTTEKTCHINGANKQIQRVKKLLNYAIKLGYIQSNPMAAFTLEFVAPHKVALTMDEIKKLWDLKLNREVLKNVRDVFMIQCFTGLCYGDIKRLCCNHITGGNNDTIWIRMQREKTNIAFAVPLLQPALLLLNKYLPDAVVNVPLLPVISNQKMNDNLKVLQELAGISKNLTTHLARHSFATTITLNNAVPISTVSRMLGHTKLSTTQIYAKVLERTIDEDMKLLSARLNNKENVQMIELQ